METEAAALEIEIVDERPGPDALLEEEDEGQDGPSPNAPATLSDLTERLRIRTALHDDTANNNGISPTPSMRKNRGAGQGPRPGSSQHLSVQGAVMTKNGRRHPKRQYLSELSALELFIVKHLAVLTLAPVVSEYFTLEELLDLIGQRKQTLWGRFVKGLKTDKKKPKGKTRWSKNWKRTHFFGERERENNIR